LASSMVLLHRFLSIVFVDIRLSGDFVTVHFFVVGSLASRPTPNLEARDYTSSDRYPLIFLACVALPGAHAPASIALRVLASRRPPLQIYFRQC
jgi:hypothetical protein